MPRKHERVRVERGLYKAGDQFIAAVTPPGERRARYKTLGPVGLMHARRLRDEWAVEIRAREPGTVVDRNVLFDTLAADWLAYQDDLVAVGELAPSTREIYGVHVRNLLGFFARRRAGAITANLLTTWHAEQRTSDASTWTIKGRWSVLRLILGYAVRRGVIQVNPCDQLTRRERPKAGDSRPRVLTEPEITSLLGCASKRYRPLIAIGVFSGLRIAEAVGLTWGDIDFDNGLIHVRHQLSRKGERIKTKTVAGGRSVILMPALARTLRMHRLTQTFTADTDAVFGTASRTPISKRNASRAFLKTATNADLEQVSFHTLRHTFASILIAQGHDVVFVADQLGHDDIATTLGTYAHLFRAAKHAEQARAAMDADYGHLLKEATTDA